MEDAAHQQIVEAVAKRVKHFHALQKPFRLYHGSTNSTRRSPRDPESTVDTSALNRVLEVRYVDGTEGGGVALVEPNVPMDALVDETLPYGLVPPVVMEFPGITAGGGFAGTSGESSSFKAGPFDANVNWIEMVLPTGEITRASANPALGATDAQDGQVSADPAAKVQEGTVSYGRTDLFWGAASSFGTLGVVTLLEVRLVPVPMPDPHVEMRYRLCDSVAAASECLREESTRPGVDYLDAIAFSSQEALVCIGRIVAGRSSVSSSGSVASKHVAMKPVRFDRARDEWFYTHALKVSRNIKADSRRKGKSVVSASSTSSPDSDSIVDHIPLRSYLFRYDRGGFWAAQYSFTYFITPFNRATRFLLDRFMHTRTLYRALHHSGLGEMYVIQDVGVPYEAVPEFAAWLDREVAIYPLWLCPLRVARDGGKEAAGHGLHAEFADPEHERYVAEMLNFGVWGPVKGSYSSRVRVDRSEVVRVNRALEQEVANKGGKKWLYAQTFYTEDEFWNVYDRPGYDELRARYGASYLPSVFDKVRARLPGDDGPQSVESSDGRGLRRRTRSILGRVWPLRGLYGVWKVIEGGDYLLSRKHDRSQVA